MKIAMNLKPLNLFALAFCLSSSVAMAKDNYREFKRDHWDFELSADYFYSEANYTSFGKGSSSLPSGNHFQLMDFSFATRYTPNKKSSYFAMMNIGVAESRNSFATRTNSTLNKVMAGVDFIAYSDLFQLIPEVSLLFPIDKVDPNSDTVANNEGVLEMHARLHVQKDFGGGRGYGWLGFDFRNEGRSFLVPWGVGYQWKQSKYRLGAEVFGFQSVTDDSVENDALRNSYINAVNAGSFKFYTSNPALVDANLYVTWLASPKWNVQVNAGNTIMGDNMAAGFHIGASLLYSFDMTDGYSSESYRPLNSPTPRSRSNMYRESELSSERKVRQFEEDLDDGVDQRQFRPRPTKEKRKSQEVPDEDFDVDLQPNGQ